MKLYKAPTRSEQPPVANQRILDAAELHATQVYAARCGVLTWWSGRSTVANGRNYVRDSVKRLRDILAIEAPAPAAIMMLEDWQIKYCYDFSELESSELARRFRLQAELCKLMSTYDERWFTAKDVRDGLCREAADRFAGLYPAELLKLVA